MAFTYDPSTLLGQVRLLVSDTDSLTPIWDDAEINAFIYMTSSQSIYASSMAVQGGATAAVPVQIYSPFLAASLALESLASNRARLASVTQLLDVKLDPAASSKALREIARGYREMEDNRGHFAIAEMIPTSFAARERIWSQLARFYNT